MYFCPCANNDPIDPETEENELFSLPRNLSYVQDSYLDRYSVSARFVHNPKLERCIQHQQGQEWRANVEDETLGLLSAITAQELHGRCDGDLESVNSSGFIFPNQDTSPTSGLSPTTSTWTSIQSTSFSATSLLRPASLVASKISAFLHSPPNESMDSARDIGTSVDGDNQIPHLQSEVCSRLESSPLNCPDSSGEEMDRDDVKFYVSSHSGESDNDERDVSVDNVFNDVCGDKKFDVEADSNFDVNLDNILYDPVNVNVLHLNNGSNSEHDVTEVDESSNPSCERNDKIVQKLCDIEGKTYLNKTDEDRDDNEEKETVSGDTEDHETVSGDTEDHETVSGDTEDHETVSDVNDIDPTTMSWKYPTLKLLDVDGKMHIPNVAKDGEKEGSGRIGEDTITGTSYGSPDSDGFSEEGVFVNIDDLDSSANEKSTTVSDASDDTCISVDSMFLSPDEGELVDEDVEQPIRKMTLEEAINRAASDLTKMSLEMYGSSLASEISKTSSTSTLLDPDEDLKCSDLGMKITERSSPVRGSPVLKVKIDHANKETCNYLTDSSTIFGESPIYSENEFNFNRVELRKSSSLKSNKTPPDTPHRKKAVRFADAMGLDLESVRHVLNMESPPKIPASALADLRNGLHEEHKEVGSRYLCPCFSQPGATDTFFQKVRLQKVSLENAIVNDLTITGFVRVSNIAYNKSVRIRYTHTAWSTFYDIAASYVQNSCDGPTDRFSFSIVAPPYFGPSSRLEFAVCYIAEGVEFWDNNDGKNYVFECFAKSIPSDSETAWLHFL